ncbi:unnamed protein product [Gongylonema pulchrum]|uniref:protein-tyrosine-phosphatase n=1 Tax=Gongylonema pulchrum TaxID=637853 RepID=A0A183DTN1_9BILA|nr:unnamed protein product [Gongylonema pulchrum]
MIQQAKEEDQGKYECVARNALGVTHSKAAHLYVKVRRVPPYFSYKLERVYKTAPGGALNLTCVAVGYPMPRVFWKKSDDTYLNDPQTAPIGRNVLTLTRIEKTENYTCIAVSKLGNIEVMTTVEVKSLPRAPENLQISEVTSRSVRVSWDAVYIEDEPVKSYIVKYRQKIAVVAPSPVLPAADLEYGEGSFKEKELYEIAVVAVSAIGRSIASMPKEVQTDETEPTSAPQKVQARALSRNSILVRWEPPEKPNGKITVRTFRYSTHSSLVKHHSFLSPFHNLPELIVRSLHEIPPADFPGQPSALAAKPLDSHRIQLTWERPLHSYNIIGYSILLNASNGTQRELTLSTPVEKHVVDGLLPNTLYSFKVAAQSARGTGAYCEEVTAKTLPNGKLISNSNFFVFKK